MHEIATSSLNGKHLSSVYACQVERVFTLSSFSLVSLQLSTRLKATVYSVSEEKIDEEMPERKEVGKCAVTGEGAE